MQINKTGSEIRKDIEFVRNFAPGFIGGKDIAKEATDEEIRHLILINNRIAKLVNDPAVLEQTGKRLLTFIALTELEESEKKILTDIRSRLTKNNKLRESEGNNVKN